MMKTLMDEVMQEAQKALWTEAEKHRQELKKSVDGAVKSRTEILERGVKAVEAFKAAFGKGPLTCLALNPRHGAGRPASLPTARMIMEL